MKQETAESEVYRFAARSGREEYPALHVLTVCAIGFILAQIMVWILN